MPGYKALGIVQHQPIITAWFMPFCIPPGQIQDENSMHNQWKQGAVTKIKFGQVHPHRLNRPAKSISCNDLLLPPCKYGNNSSTSTAYVFFSTLNTVHRKSAIISLLTRAQSPQDTNPLNPTATGHQS